MSVRDRLRKALIVDPSEQQNEDPDGAKGAGGLKWIKDLVIQPEEHDEEANTQPIASPPGPTKPPPAWLTPSSSSSSGVQPAVTQPQTQAQPPNASTSTPSVSANAQQTAQQTAAPASTTASSNVTPAPGSSPTPTIAGAGNPPPAQTAPTVPSSSPPASVAPTTAPPTSTATPVSVKVEFGAIYEMAGIRTPGFTAERMLEMVSRLPAEFSTEQKRLTVMATLDAMGKELGATPETIVTDARSKIAVLGAHTEALAKQTEAFVVDTSAEIVAQQAQIEEKRRAIEDAQRKEAETRQACQIESNRLENILKFFGADTTPSNSP